ncbi:MAG TPA: TM2 domain-containing protein [Ohtaekwangia sp.]|nr:TM2 domain-containing protein [Ohtaekwangia sp.]
MARIIDVLPELTGEEMLFVQQLIKDLDDERARTFATVYRNRRRDPLLLLVLTLLGFVGFAGIHRMLTDQIGMGILYFFTAGLCLIGTIVDLVNYQKMAFEYNSKIAREVMLLV